MTETQSIGEPVERKRVSFVFLLGAITLAGHFWPLLDRMLTFAIVRSARRGSEVEGFGEFLRRPLAITSTQFIVVTVLLALWIVFGQRLRESYPRMAIVLVAIAIFSHFIFPLLFTYVALVHGVR